MKPLLYDESQNLVYTAGMWRTPLIGLIALVTSGLAVAQSADPKTAYQELVAYRAQLYKEARDAKTQINFSEVDAKLKAKAEEVIKGVDLDSVEARNAYDWAKVVEFTKDYKRCCDLAKKFLTSKPDDKHKFDAMLLMSSSCNNLGEADMLAMTLRDIPVPDFVSSTQIAYPTVNSYVDTIYEAKGLKPALSTLSTVEKKMVYETPSEYAKRILQVEKNRPKNGAALIKDPSSKATTDEERLKELEKQAIGAQESQRFMFDEKRAELYKEAGDRNSAIKVLKAASAKMAKDSPNYRRATSALLQMTLTGSKAPAVVAERSYGEYKGLEALHGKVVIIDFFAHWCGPCIASFPDMAKMYADLHSKGLEIVGVTTYYGFYKSEGSEKRDMAKDTEFAKMSEFIADHKLPWPVVYGERSNMEAYGVTGIPTAVVIDREGNVHELHVGYSKESFEAFRTTVEALLGSK